MKVKVDPEIPERGRTRGRSKGTAEKNPKKRNQGLNCAKMSWVGGTEEGQKR